MDDKKFVITDAEGIPEGIKDPLAEPIADPKPAPTKKTASPRVAKPAKQDPTPKRPGRPSKSDLEREVATELQAMLMLGSAIWGQYDGTCAVVLSAQSKDISDSLAAILAKHPALLSRMRDMTGFGDYLGLAVAILPVVKAISEHHVQPGLQKREPIDA